MSGPFVASKIPFEEAKRAKQDVSKEATKGGLKATAQEGERGSSTDSAKESVQKEGQQAPKDYMDSNLFAAAGLNVPSRPPPLSKSAQVSYSPALHSVQPAYLMPSLRIMNPQYGIQQNIRVLPSADASVVFSSQPVSGGEIELPQARIERIETREAGNTSSVASVVPADASAAAITATITAAAITAAATATTAATTTSTTTTATSTAPTSTSTAATTTTSTSKNTQEDTSMPKLNDAPISSMDDAVKNGQVQTQQGGSESSESASAHNKTVQMPNENEGGNGLDTSKHTAASSTISPNQKDREVAAKDAGVQKTIDEPSEGPNTGKHVAQTMNESAVSANSVNTESGANASGSNLRSENKTIDNPSVAKYEIPSAHAKAITPTLGTNPTILTAPTITNPTITIASTSTAATPPATASTNTTTTSTSDASALETRMGAAIATGKDSTIPTERRIPTYTLDNEIDDVVELLDPLSSFSITPSGPASPEHPGSNLPTEGINMDPLNDIEDEEFSRNELGHVSSAKQKKMPKNEGGGIVFSDCNVDIHTLNNYSSSSNMSEVGFYLRSILKELKEFQKLMTRNSALEERLSSVERTLNALVHREDKD